MPAAIFLTRTSIEVLVNVAGFFRLKKCRRSRLQKISVSRWSLTHLSIDSANVKTIVLLLLQCLEIDTFEVTVSEGPIPQCYSQAEKYGWLWLAPQTRCMPNSMILVLRCQQPQLPHPLYLSTPKSLQPSLA